MLMIRYQRIGRTNDPAFRIVLVEKERAAKTGRVTEQLGSYNPKTKALSLNGEKVQYWISKGAQPTDSIHNLLVKEGVIAGKKINVLPKKIILKKEEEPVVEAAPAAPEAPVAEAASETAPVVAEAASEAAPAEEVPAA